MELPRVFVSVLIFLAVTSVTFTTVILGYWHMQTKDNHTSQLKSKVLHSPETKMNKENEGKSSESPESKNNIKIQKVQPHKLNEPFLLAKAYHPPSRKQYGYQFTDDHSPFNFDDDDYSSNDYSLESFDDIFSFGGSDDYSDYIDEMYDTLDSHDDIFRSRKQTDLRKTSENLKLDDEVPKSLYQVEKPKYEFRKSIFINDELEPPKYELRDSLYSIPELDVPPYFPRNSFSSSSESKLQIEGVKAHLFGEIEDDGLEHELYESFLNDPDFQLTAEEMKELEIELQSIMNHTEYQPPDDALQDLIDTISENTSPSDEGRDPELQYAELKEYDNEAEDISFFNVEPLASAKVLESDTYDNFFKNVEVESAPVVHELKPIIDKAFLEKSKNVIKEIENALPAVEHFGDTET